MRTYIIVCAFIVASTPPLSAQEKSAWPKSDPGTHKVVSLTLE